MRVSRVTSVDIMMPFYGRLDHFQAAVRSVLGQSDPHWRLVVIDDQYPDPAPARWVTDIGDPRIHYLRNEINLGVAGNFRKAAALAEADYTVIMGCDDIMLPGYLAAIRTLTAQFPDAAVIQPGVGVIDEDGHAVVPLGDRVKSILRPDGSPPAVYGGDALAASLLRGAWTYFPSLCWRTAVLKKHEFRADFEVVLDLALLLEIIIDGGTILVSDDREFLYRRHSSSVSSWTANDGSRFTQESQLFRESRSRLESLGWHRGARAAALHLTSRLNALTKLPQALRHGSRAERAVMLAHALRR